MKKLFYSLIVAFFAFSSCSTDDDQKPSQISVDGKQYKLSIGTIEDNGTNDALTYRYYDLEFKDKESNPSSYFKFRIYSSSTTRLQEGTYEYSYSSYAKNKFSYVKFAHSLVYDSKNVITGGTIYDEDDLDITGTIIVGKSGSLYNFDINFTATDESTNKTYTIKGYFEESLTEGYVYLSK